MTENKEQFDILGKRLAECRRTMNMTQEELANRISVTPQALSQYERGVRYPDLMTLKALCNIFKTSADYLLGNEEKIITENGDNQNEIWWNLRSKLEPLKMIFGEEIVPVFLNGGYVDCILSLRKELSLEGTLLPIVKIEDWVNINPREFIILAYDNVIYNEEIDADKEISLEYIINKLGFSVRENYHKILSIDIVKNLVDNIKINHPALIEGIIPEKISYGLLTTICKRFVQRGNTLLYLPKIIEIIQNVLRTENNVSDDQILEYIINEIELEENIWVFLGKEIGNNKF